MSDTKLRNLTIHVSSATEDYQRAVAEGAPVNILLERIWSLQDWLGRLVDAASDRPGEIDRLLESLRHSITEAVDSGFSPRAPFPVTFPAVMRSRVAIQRSLAELDLMSGGFAFMHAAGV